MKKIWGIFAGIALAGAIFGSASLFADSANAAQTIAGQNCFKKGSTKIVGSKKFTCVLVGKKLKWNSGVLLAPTRPKITPAPQPTPSPTSTDSSKSPNDQLSDKILAVFKASANQEAYKFDLTLCPLANKTKANEAVIAYKDALRFWANFFQPSRTLKWVIFSERDYDCWLATAQKLEGPGADIKVWNPVTNQMGHCQLAPDAFCGYGTGVKADGLFVQYNAIGIAYSKSPNASVVHHEAVHLYQMALQSESTNTAREPVIPAWFVEGQANLFGMTIANKGTATNQRNFEISRLKNAIPGAEAFDQTQWLAKLYELENHQDFIIKNELGYSLGWLILEKFYQSFSFTQMHELLLTAHSASSWNQALKSALGTSTEAFYPLVAAYLADEVN